MYNNYGTREPSSRKGIYSFQKPKIWDLRKAVNDKKVQLLKTLPRMRSPDMFTSTIPLLLSTKFELIPEEKVIIESLRMKSLLATKSGNGIIKFNPRPIIAKKTNPKKSERIGVYLKPVNVSKFEIEIEEISDDDW